MDLYRYPDRDFFWSICFTVQPNWAQAYFDKVMKKRNHIKSKELNETKIIKVSD